MTFNSLIEFKKSFKIMGVSLLCAQFLMAGPAKVSEFGGIGIQIKENDQGFYVYRVLENSPAAKAGIQSGDLIESIDFQSTESMKMNDVVEFIRGAEGETVHLEMTRQSSEIEFEVARTSLELSLSTYREMESKATEIINKDELIRHLEAIPSAQIFVDDQAVQKDYVRLPNKSDFRIFSVGMTAPSAEMSEGENFSFELPSAGNYQISIYNPKGELVETREALAWQTQVGLQQSSLHGIHLVVVRQGNFEKSFKHKF